MEKTWKPTTAGVLSIIGGSMGICLGVLIIFLGGLVGLASTLGTYLGEPALVEFLLGIGKVAGAAGGVIIALGAIGIAGGVCALKRRHWGMALAGPICALPTSGVLGILSIIFVSIGKKEFS